MKIQRLTIDELLTQKDTDPVWCINNTPRAMTSRAGDLILMVPKIHGNGTPDKVLIPRTWLPYNLIRQVPRQQLLQATEFLRALDSGILIAVSAEYAAYLASKEGAAEERERLNQYADRIRNAVAHTVTEDEDSRKKLELESDDGYDPVFVMHVNQWNTMQDIEVLNALRAAKYTRKQYQYIAQHLKNHPKTLTAIQKVLNRVKK